MKVRNYSYYIEYCSASVAETLKIRVTQTKQNFVFLSCDTLAESMQGQCIGFIVIQNSGVFFHCSTTLSTGFLSHRPRWLFNSLRHICSLEGRESQRREGEKEEKVKIGRKKKREGMFLLFKGTNQKLHMLLLHTYYQPELRHAATISYQENLKYSFDWAVIYPVKIFITVQEENTLKDSWQPLPHNSKNQAFR